MFLKHLLFIILFVLVGTASRQTLARGTESGGGGTTIVKEGQRLLLDYLVLDSSFKDQSQHQAFYQHRFSKADLEKNRGKIFSSRFEDFVGSRQTTQRQNADFFRSGPFELALNIIEEWNSDNDLNFLTDSSLYGLFYPVSWQITDQGIIGKPAELKAFENLSLSQVDLTAYYQRFPNNDYLIRISSRTWNELGLVSQAGLLIHEGMRHYQLAYGFPDEYYFDDSVLQKATAIMMLCRPRPTLSMYLNYILMNKEKETEKLSQFGSFSVVIEKYCQKRKF